MLRKERSSLEANDMFIKFKNEKRLDDIKTQHECFNHFDKDKLASICYSFLVKYIQHCLIDESKNDYWKLVTQCQ